jgi:3',5'-nucleoside bisphosphate phosphatase
MQNGQLADARPAVASASMFVDLHMHSTASDGARTPTEVVEAARVAKLSAIALTDHDTVGGVREAQGAGARLGIRVVAGVELSAVEGDAETHLLGLHLELLDEMQEQLESIRAMRITRAQRIVERLNALGVKITTADVLEQAGGGAVGRPHVARAMIAHGWVGDNREAFDRFLGYGRPAYVGKDRLPMSEAIAMIHRAGGLAILAHPGEAGKRARLEALAAEGLDGVEIRHPSHTPEDIMRLGALAAQLGLLPSGGSDWHGTADRVRAIGMMEVPVTWLQRQDEALAARRAAR